MTIESLVSLVFDCGLAIQVTMARNTEGISNYSMTVVIEQELEQVVKITEGAK